MGYILFWLVVQIMLSVHCHKENASELQNNKIAVLLDPVVTQLKLHLLLMGEKDKRRIYQ